MKPRLSMPSTAANFKSKSFESKLKNHSLSPVFELNDEKAIFYSESSDVDSESEESVDSDEKKKKSTLENKKTLKDHIIQNSKSSPIKKYAKKKLKNSKQSTTKHTMKEETLFEEGQKIKWVEMNKSKTTFEKRYVLKNLPLTIKENEKNLKYQKKIPIVYPTNDQKTPRNSDETPSNHIGDDASVDTKLPARTITRTLSSRNVPKSLLTLENPLKISDSFESPPVEVKSMNLFKQRMGTFHENVGKSLKSDKNMDYEVLPEIDFSKREENRNLLTKINKNDLSHRRTSFSGKKKEHFLSFRDSIANEKYKKSLDFFHNKNTGINTKIIEMHQFWVKNDGNIELSAPLNNDNWKSADGTGK